MGTLTRGGTAGVIDRLGARSVFVDIDPRSFNIRTDLVSRKITPRTRAIMPVHLFGRTVIRVQERDRLRAFLKERGVETEIYYPLPLHLQECFEKYGHRSGDFPEAEAAAHDSLALPIYPELTEEQTGFVVGLIREFYG